MKNLTYPQMEVNTMANQIKRIAIITSGGDSQGMNVAVRAVVLAARQYEDRKSVV